MKKERAFNQMKTLEQKLYDIIEKLRALDLDNADGLDIYDIIDDIDDARDSAFVLNQVLQTL